MIISPERRFIFVHIPKTGGTSLALALEGRAKADDILIGDTPKARRRKGRVPAQAEVARGRLWKHSTLADIEGLMTRDFIAQAFCVTLVRNPWDRLVSLYHWARVQKFDHPMVSRAQSTDFAAFLHAPETQAELRAQPYGHYLTDSEGQPQPVHCIRLEHFEADAAPLWAHLGFRLTLPHVNASGRETPYQNHYDRALADLVGDVCAEDISRFGYAFDG